MAERIAIAAAAALMLASSSALAQEPATVQVAESEEYGQYLTDAEGRALYLFTADTQAQGDAAAQVSCSGECLDRWPPLYTDGAPEAGEEVDESLLSTIDFNGQMMVTYNGWPLYYFFQDEGAGETTGQDIQSFGGEWYLVSPDGDAVHEE